jgi:dTDP-4-dehydrorhamnose reductase
MKPKMLIVGKDGYLGSHLFNSNLISERFDLFGSARTSGLKLDLGAGEISDEVSHFFKKTPPKYLVITAAIADVERCAMDPTTTRKTNVAGTKAILELARSSGTIPIFFSSDYVLKPATSLQFLNEADECLPATEYGRQKKEVEDWITVHFKQFLIFRTSKLMGMASHPRNILSQITTNSRAFTDQWMTPVFIEDIARVIAHPKLEGLSGKYHLATKTPYTRYDLAMLMGNPSKIIPATMDDLTTLEKRPRFNTLNSEKICLALDFEFTEIKFTISNHKPS